MSKKCILVLCIWLCRIILFPISAGAQKVYPCDHRYGAVASWSQCTDVLVPDSRYDAELWAFKYNLALTVFDSPYSVLVTTDKAECFLTGRLSWEVYFQIDRWVKPDDYEYPEDYPYYGNSKYPFIPDYFMEEWTEVGKHYFPMVKIGYPKHLRYPNHGQELYDISNGEYGYDWESNIAGFIDVLSDLVENHRDLVKAITGCYPSCLSYRFGKTGARYAMKEWFLAGRNSVFYVGSKSRTAYGQSKITGLYLGNPNGFIFNHENALCQPSSSRYWDSWQNPYSQPYFKTRDEALSHCETLLMNTIENRGWYNDFTHWHTTTGDDLDVFFASQRRVIGNSDVFTGGYGECMQHLFLRDSVESISTHWEGEVCVIEVHVNGLPEKLPLSTFSIPLSVQIDLSETELAGKNIGSGESPGIRKLGQDMYSVDVPFDREEGFRMVRLEETKAPDYLDFELPAIVFITAEDKFLTVKTNIPTRLALFWAPQGAPEYAVKILFRSNNLQTVHRIDFNDPAVLNYSGDMTWENVVNGDIYIGAITGTKQSVLADVYHYGDTRVSVESAAVPHLISLSTNYPNPFNFSTSLQFEIPEEMRVTLRIYSILGQKIKTLVNSIVLPGKHTVTWDGTDDSCIPVSSGIYIMRLNAEENIATCRMLLMK